LHSLSRDVVAGTALYLLPRKLGLGCRLAEDPMLALQCASGGGGCHPNREARARAEMVEGSDVKFAEAQRLADAMADAVRRRDAAAFIKPH
jgi:hypothetical protein